MERRDFLRSAASAPLGFRAIARFAAAEAGSPAEESSIAGRAAGSALRSSLARCTGFAALALRTGFAERARFSTHALRSGTAWMTLRAGTAGFAWTSTWALWSRLPSSSSCVIRHVDTPR